MDAVSLQPCFDAATSATFATTTKIGLVATRDGQGLPHITFLPNLQVQPPSQVLWGQLMEGASKDHIRRDPRAAFLALTLDRHLITGPCRWTHEVTSGEAYQRLNALPMYRYNAYINLSRIHCMEVTGPLRRGRISLPGVAMASLLSMAAKPWFAEPKVAPALTERGRRLFNALSTYSFLACIDENGHPELHPLLQARAADRRRIIFALPGSGPLLRRLQPGVMVALFGISTRGESLLLRGPFRGFRGLRPLRFGSLDITWVYNSNPPIHGQIDPPLPALDPQACTAVDHNNRMSHR